MKHLIILFYFLHFISAKAQMCPCEFAGSDSKKLLRNEFGLNLFNYHEMLFNFNSPRPAYLSSYANGFMLKHHFNKYSVRAGFDYFENTYSYEARNTSEYNFNDGKSFGKDFRIGVEKTLYEGKLQPYAAADLLFSSDSYSGLNHGGGDTIANYSVNYAFKARAYGVSPAVGIRYRPFRHFSISAEAALSVIYYKTYATNGYSSESAVAVLANPLRLLSVNYHF